MVPDETAAEGELSAQPTVETTAPPAASSLSELSGELPDVVPASGSPYLVTADIVIPPGRTVTIEPGVFLLFRNFTGVQVHGTLIAVGTKESPIAFSSEHDQRHGSQSVQAPAPYDWNGITVTENALGTKFEFCRIGYSLYGINSLTEYVTIIDCVFNKNGKSDVTIKGTKQEVAAKVPYSYKPLGDAPVLAGAEGPSGGKIALRTTGIAVLVVGVAVGVWKTIDFMDSDEQYSVLSNTADETNLRNPSIVEDWQEAQDTRNTDLTLMIVGYGAGVLGAAAVGVTFLF
jgi:hypothetical protein